MKLLNRLKSFGAWLLARSLAALRAIVCAFLLGGDPRLRLFSLKRAYALFSFEPQDLLDIKNVAVSPNKQNTFLTPVSAASYTYRPRNPGTSFAAISPQFYSDEQLANKGHQWPTVKQRILQDTSFDWGFDLDSFMAGWALFFAMGADTVTGTGPWTHTFKFLQSTNQMPVTSLLFQDTADVIYQLPDLAIMDLVMSGKESGPLQCQVKMVGSGKNVEGSVAFPALGTPLFLLGSDTDIKLGTAAPNIFDPKQQFTLSTTVLGALGNRTAFYKFTYQNAAGETLASQEMSIAVPASSVSKVTGPAVFPAGITAINIYGSIGTGTETKQVATITTGGGIFTEPATGFVAGSALPTVTTALSSIKERVRDWQVHLVMEMQLNRAPGGGLFGTFMKVLKQRANWQISVAAKDVDDLRTIGINDTSQELQIITNSGASAQLTLQFPGSYPMVTAGSANGREIVWPISAGDQDVFKNSPQELFQAVVINNQATYGVGA
jgi:hypothetical protein